MEREVARADAHPRPLLYVAELAIDEGDVARARELVERARGHRQIGDCEKQSADVQARLDRFRR